MLEEKLTTTERVNKKTFNLCCSLIASMTSDRALIFNEWKFFIQDNSDWNIENTVDKSLVNKENYWFYVSYDILLSWVTKELFNRSVIKVQIPIIKEWKKVTSAFRKLFSSAISQWFIDDMWYQAYMTILTVADVYIFNDKIWFSFIEWEDTKTSLMKVNNKWQRVNWWRSTIRFEKLELEEVLDAEIQQWFVNKEIWDPNRWYWYTHLLRASAKFTLTKWFRNILVNWKKINIIYATRWSWKTYDAAYIVCRALLNPNPWFWWRPYREIKYFVDNKDTIWENFFRYAKALLSWLADKRIDWVKLFKINESSYTIECSLTWNRLEVISLYNLTRWTSKELWVSVWEWIACDDCIIDEAARIPDKFWTSFYQRAAFETSSFFIITTANEETPVNHWSYKLLLKWESMTDDNIMSYRITIDDNEILKNSVPKDQVDRVIEDIKNSAKEESEEAYYARMYCIIFDKKKIFQIQSCLLRRFSTDNNDPRVIILDPAKLSDNAWLSIINLKHQVIEQSEKLVNSDYSYQIKRVEELKKLYPNSVAVCDRWWAWEFLAETDIEWVIDIRIKSTWQWDLKSNWVYYTISKWKMVSYLEFYFKRKILRIFDDLTDLIEQFNKFVEIKSNRSSIVLYKWEWKTKDDLVLSVINGATYMHKILWLHSKEDMLNYSNQFENYSTYSYNVEDNNDNEYYNPVY